MKMMLAIVAITMAPGIWVHTARARGAFVEPVRVELTASPDRVDAGSGKIMVTITNDGPSPVTIYKYRLPFGWNGPLPNNQFSVRSPEGTTQEYIGDFDYVVGTNADNSIHLQPHQVISGKVDLRLSYRFDEEVSHSFKVRYRLPLGIVVEGDEADENSPDYENHPNRRRVIESNEVEIFLDPTAGQAATADCGAASYRAEIADSLLTVARASAIEPTIGELPTKDGTRECVRAEFFLTPWGTIYGIKFVESSRNAPFEMAVRRAIDRYEFKGSILGVFKRRTLVFEGIDNKRPASWDAACAEYGCND